MADGLPLDLVDAVGYVTVSVWLYGVDGTGGTVGLVAKIDAVDQVFAAGVNGQ
jgi:hypothetical protein